MLRDSEPDGPYITGELAAYPERLNVLFANALLNPEEHPGLANEPSGDDFNARGRCSPPEISTVYAEILTTCMRAGTDGDTEC